jgi:hypothetical protein
MAHKILKKKISTTKVFYLLIVFSLSTNFALSQCKPKIKIDNIEVIADMDEVYGLHLPYWLNSGQTLAVGSNVSKISLIEFHVDTLNSTLEFSQVLNISSTSPQTVPAGNVWKIESIAKIYTPSNYSSITYSSPGTYTFNVPSCAESICIDIWGAGGGGGFQSCYNSSNCWSGGGASGGAFGSQCYSVNPGQSLTIVVGAGGGPSANGTNSSVIGGAINLIANGGSAGTNSNYNVFNGASVTVAGGTCVAVSNSPGGSSNGVTGGSGGNGGSGGTGNVNGGFPGGGGGGGVGYNNNPGSGANGKVVISW